MFITRKGLRGWGSARGPLVARCPPPLGTPPRWGPGTSTLTQAGGEQKAAKQRKEVRRIKIERESSARAKPTIPLLDLKLEIPTLAPGGGRGPKLRLRSKTR